MPPSRRFCRFAGDGHLCQTDKMSLSDISANMNLKASLLPLIIILVTALTSGCASITSSAHQSISVQTSGKEGKDIRDAACELSNDKGKWFVTSPGSVTVTASNDDMQVFCNKEGSEPGRASVVSRTKVAMFGNVLLGGGIGAIVDYNTGAGYEYPAFIHVVMGAFTRIEAPNPVAQQPAGGDQIVQTGAIQPFATQPATPQPPANPPNAIQPEADVFRSPRIYVIPNPRYESVQ